MKQGTTLRLELFIRDLPASLDFYRRVLGFEWRPQQSGGYTPLGKGAVHIALNLLSDLADDHPIHLGAHERPGRGVEIVLEVDDIEAMYHRRPLAEAAEPVAIRLEDLTVLCANCHRAIHQTKPLTSVEDFRRRFLVKAKGRRANKGMQATATGSA